MRTLQNRPLGRMTLGAIASLLTASAAFAQCDVYRTGIPDMDQRRDGDNQGHLGLPGDGAMYCAPTAVANIMGYIANHGYPVAMGMSANWQSQTYYNDCRAVIYQLGFLMSTDPVTGTGGDEWFNGTHAWLAAKGLSGHMFVLAHGVSNGVGPTPGQLFGEMAIGGLVSMGYGRYSETSPGSNRWQRSGGHVITLDRVYNACTNTPLVGWRDPNTSPSTESLFAQSSFATRYSTMDRDTIVLSDNSVRTAWKFTDISDSTRRYLDGVVTVWPMFGLTAGPTFGKLLVIKDLTMASYPAMQNQEITITGAGAAIDALFNHVTHTHLVLTGAGAAGGPSQVWDVDPRGTSASPILSVSPTPYWIKTNRHGELLVGSSSGITRYRLGGRVPVSLGTIVPPFPPEEACIDDATDELIILGQPAAGGPRRIGWITRAMTLRSNEPLPTGVTMAGDGSVIINPLDRRLWVTSHGSTLVWELGVDAVGRLFINSSASHSQLRNINVLNFTDEGHMIALCDGSVREFDKDPTNGRWAPTPSSIWTGRTGQTFLTMPFSRTNYDPIIHSGPGWENTDVVETAPEILDCAADVDNGLGSGRPDGGVGIEDLLFYLAIFDQGTSRADLDDGSSLGHPDGGVGIEDLLYYLARYDLGC